MAVHKKSRHMVNLDKMLKTHEVTVACKWCCREENEITFSLINTQHNCIRNILLARQKDGVKQWRPVKPLPLFPKPFRYVVCCHFVEGQGCVKHRTKCSYARSTEEANVWNFLKDTGLEYDQFVRLVRYESSAEPRDAVEKIQLCFQGTFLELCETCFYQSPQKISVLTEKQMHYASGHTWKPLLVFCPKAGPENYVAYEEIRPLTSTVRWTYCRYVQKGEPYWHGAHRCWFAHSQVEMAVWKAEKNGGLDRSKLLSSSQGQQHQQSRVHYCKACKQQLLSKEEFMNHCFTVNHRERLMEDRTSKWKYRDPPQLYNIFTMCKRPSSCEYGDRCVEAHSSEELEEWRKREKEIWRKVKAAEDQGLLSYQDSLLREYRNSKDQELIMSEFVPGVRVSCETDLCISVRKEGIPHRWKLNIKSKEPLVVVALLKQVSGATFTISDNYNEERTYSSSEWFQIPDSGDYSYNIPVSFVSLRPGLFEQWLVLDFDSRPVLLQKLKARVGEQLFPHPEKIPDSVYVTEVTQSPESERKATSVQEDWNEENSRIVPYLERAAEEQDLLSKYRPSITSDFNIETDESINQHNYKKRMHSFLYQEELVEDKLISRLNLLGSIHLSQNLWDPWFGLKFAPPGMLFGTVTMSHPITPNTPEGFILKRMVQSVLVGPVYASSHQHKQVYEALIIPETDSHTQLHLQLSERCCTDLELRDNSTCKLEVQFQLNHQFFCELHRAVDLLQDLRVVLPDLSNCCVPAPITTPAGTLNQHKLNQKQQAATDFILGRPDGKRIVAPLLIYGPFGTGKTSTLAAVTLVLVQNPQNKVLICTHTNSSADLYVKDYFHEHVTAVSPNNWIYRPLRIKAKEVSLNKTDEVTKQYCQLSRDGSHFEFPDKYTLDSARIIITTVQMARFFHDLKLPSNYFSHIMIDEASQMLECEALMAVGLAGEGTRVVLAGDHMQMGPKLFSVEDDRCSDHTLLNRLFYYYQAENNSTAKASRIIFNENYRSTKEIVDFVSTHFYVGKSDAIKASGNVPSHPQLHPLQFHHIRGQCHLDPTTMSWFNREESQGVVEIVWNILNNWPEEWERCDPSEICVLSQRQQVLEIRSNLKQLSLSNVTVESAENVQGKQFRVIVISTVHTSESLKLTSPTCLEFFNDTRVLNTVMTRAKSLLVVIGDAAALCYYGKCSMIWRSYIDHCIRNGSAQPEHITTDFVKQELQEVSRFCGTDEDDNGDTESSTSESPDLEDPILRELLDETKDFEINVTEEGLFPIPEELGKNIVMHAKEKNQDHSEHQWKTMLKNCPTRYKQCYLYMERFDSGYATPLDDPTLQIEIRGTKNVGQSFHRDQVLVEILDEEENQGKVVQVLNSMDISRVFVCTLDIQDSQVMTPINICIPKIYTPFWKDKPNYIAVRKEKDLTFEKFVEINAESRRNSLFIVKVLKWRENFRYPLGIVVKVLPKVTSLDAGLEVLDIEFRLQRTLPPPVQRELTELINLSADTGDRKDFRGLTTFTIDPSNSLDLDDAISVTEYDTSYEIGIHIADVASFVTKGSELDKYAKHQGTAFYPPEREPAYMFPKDLSTDYFSLLPGQDRRAISLMVQVNKDNHKIQQRSFVKSVIRSQRKLSYEDVDEILQQSTTKKQCCNSIEGCLAVACHLAETHRKGRKQEDWCYKSPDENIVIGNRQSHRMVEELMIMFNNAVADRLLWDERSRNCTPLRCQNGPNREQLHNFVEEYRSYIPLSIHFSYQINGAKQEIDSSDSQAFPILKSLLQNLEIAAHNKDISRIIDLITTDDIHPCLLPLVIAFRRLICKANVLRSNSTHLSKIGHYDLDLDCYTWASSPIRRYVDVVIQRLLHSVLERKPVEYTLKDIDLLCVEFSQKNNSQSVYKRKASSLNLASKLSCQNARKVAYVIEVTPTGKNFRVSFPMNRPSLPETTGIMFRDLQLTDQPEYDEINNCTILHWKRRVYSFTNSNIHYELRYQEPDSLTAPMPLNAWSNLLSALRKEDWNGMLQTLENITSTVNLRASERTRSSVLLNNSKMRESDMKDQHYTELIQKVKQGEILEVQLGTDTARGLLVPTVQLLIVHPKFEICLEHSKDPVLCFSKYALRSARTSYNTYMEYQSIWKPLSEMESACNAVAENESVVLEDVALTWKQTKREQNLQGYFRLPIDKKKEWALECDFRNCFLCIRMRTQRTDQCSIQTDANAFSQYVDLTDIPSVIWVAHGLTTRVTDEEDSKKLMYIQIDFCINHKSMTNIPDSVFSVKTRFTVELIPKLLPDVRKENAVDNLTKANQLVKEIAMGKRRQNENTKIPRQKFARCDIASSGFKPLNNSQCKAIREALSNRFTLIQGPPGTGKTVVGVHIVYWFFRDNQTVNIPKKQKAGDELPKKKCILYCGPSNKSVDVIAGQLLKLKAELKPLRIYSEQIEMLEFPYPGSSLKLSRRTIREERPNEELRSITLHHLVRKPDNPRSAEILAFDARIQRGDDLTEDEIQIYKKTLQDARKHELLQHDVILCTCTAASSPSLSKELSFPQIIIDECAMATEPEALIPLVTHKPEQIVLLGDHKQLQPIVHCDLVQRLGMKTSLFERYMDKALMLDTQYRMHEDICAFPSAEFYRGNLKTGVRRKPSLLLTQSSSGVQRQTSIIFGHVEGNEESLVVSTERGNENSKANVEEARETVRITRLLIQAGVKEEEIAILTPYNAQVAKINETLASYNVRNITVNTIMKSQGSEWRYVILSTVRSCPEEGLEMKPTKAWLHKRLGFVMDHHQVNVGITRAQEGLCIIGNAKLLRCCFLWRKLLDHYKERGCMVDPANNITIQKVSHLAWCCAPPPCSRSTNQEGSAPFGSTNRMQSAKI
ncbi:helicase with zinc finger domain 2 [Chanos chanos]|uniref:Helicase with zinc finger domain 2 n=1 Tax=Chanos chanos TaxID=29144 RepID=A0A6J2VQL9_CHACN|nr:helicase with zinc finger domain 2-like [Chanos chanos]